MNRRQRREMKYGDDGRDSYHYREDQFRQAARAIPKECSDREWLMRALVARVVWIDPYKWRPN